MNIEEGMVESSCITNYEDLSFSNNLKEKKHKDKKHKKHKKHKSSHNYT